MEIKSYKEARNIEKKYFSSLADSEIECWGQKPFDEFLICKNPSCRTLFSIEDVYGDLQSYRKRKDNSLAQNFSCTCCDSQAEFMYEKESFLELIKEYVKGEVSAVLLISDEDKVEGFGILSKGSLEKIIYEVFDKRPGGWDKEKVIENISMEIFGNKNSRDKEFICSHQIYVSPDYREGDMSLKILKSLFSLNDEFSKYPIIGETRYDSKFYPFTRLMGYKNLVDDKYGNILQISKYYDMVIEFLHSISSLGDKKIFADVLKYRKEAIKTLNIKNFKTKTYIN